MERMIAQMVKMRSKTAVSNLAISFKCISRECSPSTVANGTARSNIRHSTNFSSLPQLYNKPKCFRLQ